MKKILLICGLILQLVASSDVPSWYPKANDPSIISYGDGATLNDAVNKAFDEVKKTLYDKGFIENLSKIDINDLDIVKQEIYKDQYFIKTAYNTSDIVTQISEVNLSVSYPLETNKYLLATPLMQDLNSTFGFYPNITIDGKYLVLDNNKYLIKHYEFEKLLASYNDDNITVDVPLDLNVSKKYFISVSTAEQGYMTLLQVYNNTDVKVLFENKKLSVDKEVIFPNFKLSDGLVIDENYQASKLETIAVLCPNREDFSEFDNIFFSVNSKPYMLGELINHTSNCKFTSVITEIKK